MKKIILILIILVAGFGVGYYIWQDLNKNVQHSVSNISQNNTASVATTSENNISISIKAPDLDRPVNISGDFSEEAKKTIISKIESLSQLLKKDNNLFNQWLELGIYRKMVNDYEGAKEVWEYANAIRPQNSISFNNLGDLYGYYLKDYIKAEQNFLKAIENDKNTDYPYIKASNFYKEVINDKQKAMNILEQGIKANPDLQVLKDILNNLKSQN